MKIEEAKKYIIEKYKYLFENSKYILIQGLKEEPIVSIEICEELMKIMEEFLFSDSELENTLLYIFIEDMKQDKEVNDRIEKTINAFETNYQEESLDIHNLLISYAKYLEGQTTDLDNKKSKKRVLDEYFGLLRYKNDGNINAIGSEITLQDYSAVSKLLNPTFSSKRATDAGVYRNSFITTITAAPYYEYNSSIFTEEEKQEVYIELHDELPYWIYINCELEDEYKECERLQRPENTKPCHKVFKIDEKEIFINPDENYYRYYQMCPHCGYIVNIPKEILSDKVKENIEKNNTEEKNLFRKNMLQSELIAIENNGPVKTLK